MIAYVNSLRDLAAMLSVLRDVPTHIYISNEDMCKSVLLEYSALKKVPYSEGRIRGQHQLPRPRKEERRAAASVSAQRLTRICLEFPVGETGARRMTGSFRDVEVRTTLELLPCDVLVECDNLRRPPTSTGPANVRRRTKTKVFSAFTFLLFL